MFRSYVRMTAPTLTTFAITTIFAIGVAEVVDHILFAIPEEKLSYEKQLEWSTINNITTPFVGYGVGKMAGRLVAKRLGQN